MGEFKQRRREYIQGQVKGDLFKLPEYERARIVQRIRNHCLENPIYWPHYSDSNLKTLLNEIIEINNKYRQGETK